MRKLLLLLTVCMCVLGCGGCTSDSTADILLNTIDTLQNERPYTWLLLLRFNGNANEILGQAEGTAVYEAEAFLDALSQYTYEPAQPESSTEEIMAELSFDDHTIYGCRGSDHVVLYVDGDMYEYRAVPKSADIPAFGDNLIQWYHAAASCDP